MKSSDIDRTLRTRRDAFTRIELFVIIVVVVLLTLLILPNLAHDHGRGNARRVNCLCNANGLWKAASGWGLDPANTWREAFPPTNLAYALAQDGVGVTPELWICPDAAGGGVNRLGNIKPATNLFEMGEHNSNYDYVSGYTGNDGDKVVIADKNGQTNGAPLSHFIAPDNRFRDDRWGGNHRQISGIPGCGGRWCIDHALGGNIIKVAGQGTWVATTNESEYAQYVITNKVVRSWFVRMDTNIVFGY